MSSHFGREPITTVAELLYAFKDVDPSTPIVVACGIGYENPRIIETAIEPVIVPNRFVYRREDPTRNAIVLRPANG